MTYVRYNPGVEQVQPDEAETLAELSRIFREVQERVLRKHGEARRGTHAKATGLLKGELVIPGDLPPELAQGLFAKPGRYEALVRLSQGVQAFFAEHPAAFEIRVQLCTDLSTMPVEDAAAVSPEEQSPHRTVGWLVLPRQAAWTEARRAYFEERVSFNPIHVLEGHRPLGSIMRARMAIYPQTQEFRQASDGVAPAEPHSLAEVPD